MQQKTIFLDQGEFLGGAERFLIDFLGALDFGERKQIQPILVGQPCEGYLKLLNEKAPETALHLLPIPSVKGGKIKKGIASLKLMSTAKKLKKMAEKEAVTQIFSNTPRTHFVAFLYKKLGGKADWHMMIHDFTTPENLMIQMAPKTTTIIANSIPSRTWLRDVLPHNQTSKIKIVENGVNFAEVPEEILSHEVKNITILGRIDPRKGQKHAVEAADLLLERNPDLQFHIVGGSVETDPNTTKYEAEIKALIKERNLKNVELYGETSEPFKVYQESDLILALPTEDETFGRIVIEAMAVGKVVITFDQTGPREIIQSYLTWLQQQKQLSVDPSILIVEAGNPMSLAEAIGFLADNPDELEIIAKYAREFVLENYSILETKKRLAVILCG